MQIIETEIADVLLLKPAVYADARGFFLESYNRRTLENLGINVDFVQDSASFSRRGVLRGLHYQKGSSSQAKLVRAVSGCILDVAIDIRAGSPTFGRSVSVELSGDNNLQIFIPMGFAHGFAVLSETAHVAYKTDAYYDPAAEGAINALDPELAIDWGIQPNERILSEKDAAAQSWAQYRSRPDIVFKGVR